MATSSPTCITHQIPHDLSLRLHTLHLRTPLSARSHHLVSQTPRGGSKTPEHPRRGWICVANGLALTCKFLVWHSWEGPETTTGAYGNCCKPAHTVHVVNHFNFNGGRGRPSSYSGRIDFTAIANALTHEERKKHIEDGLCFKCHNKGH
jgi:hypothetical protein